jgi:hypothetical protein
MSTIISHMQHVREQHTQHGKQRGSSMCSRAVQDTANS